MAVAGLSQIMVKVCAFLFIYKFRVDFPVDRSENELQNNTNKITTMKKQNLLLKMLLLCLCVVGSANAWADPTYKNIASDTKVFPTSYSDLSTAITEGWISTTSDNFSNKGASINPQTGEAYGSATNVASKIVKAGNDKKTIKFYVTNVSAIRVYGANGGSGSRRIKVTATPSDASGATTSYGTAAGSGVTQVINMNLTSSKSYEIDITGVAETSDEGADCSFQGIWFTAAAAANDPVNPTFTPDGGSIEGNSTVTVASTYAQKIFYYWSDISTAPSQGDASYTEAEGASADVTAPNEAGTKYLHAYGWNNKNTNTYTNTITKTFTITEGKELPGLEYAVAEVAKYTTDANFTNTLTNPHDLTVTYSVEDGATATGVEVNASTGEVTIGSVAGTATIKASFAGDETYQAGEATYVLTVTKPTCAVPTYTLGSYNYEQGGYEIVASCDTDGATLQYKIGNGSFTTCTDGVAFYAKSGKLVIKASKDGYNDATIASGIQWTLNGAPSSTSPETLIPFQTSSDDGEKNKAHVYKSVTFGETNNASSIGGVSGSNGLKIRTNQTHGDFANSVKFYVHDGYKVTNIQMTGNSNNDNAAISVNGMYVDGGDNAISSVTGNKTFPNSKTDAATFDTGSIEATDNVVLTFDNSNIDGTSGKKNKQLKVDIVVTYEVTAVSVSTKSGRNYGTYVTSYKLDFSSAEGITAYIAKGFNGAKDAIVLQEVDIVPASTPIIVKTDTKGATVNVPTTDASASDVLANALVAGDGTTTWDGTTGYTYYYIASDEFHKATSGTLQSGKAYLKISSSLVPVEEARSFGFVIDDEETTGISAALNDNGQMINDNVVYDLQGRRVTQPTKGLYIVNGRKFFKK